MIIKFEANTSGFEQISKALEQQQKLLNENAAAAERLAKAQQGITKPQGAGRQDESLNYFKEQAKTIKDVTGALQQLNQTQGGLHSFMSTFSKFRGELSASAAEQKGGIFSVLALQVDNLKKSLATSALNIGEFKSQIKDLETSLASDPNNPNLRSQLGDARGFMSASQQQLTRDQYLYSQARMVQMMHQPIGTTLAGNGEGGGPPTGLLAGLAGRGISPAQFMRYGGMALAAGYAANKWINHAAFADEEADANVYKYNKNIYGNAMQGNLGEYYLKSRGVGRFGALNRADRGEGIDTAAEAWASGKGITEKASNLIGTMYTGVTGWLGGLSDEQIRAQKVLFLNKAAGRHSEAEADAFNATSSATLRSIMNPAMRRMDIEKGHGYARGIEDLLLRRGIGLDEAGSGLAMAGRMGIDRGMLARSGSDLLRSGLETGLGDKAREQLFRRISMGGIGQRLNLEQFLGEGQRAGIDVRGSLEQREMFTGAMANIQGQFGGAVSEQEVGGRFLGALQSMSGSNMNAADKISVAANANSMMQNAISDPTQMMGAGMMKVLYGYNLPPHVVAILQSQIAGGRIDAAAKVIKQMSNTPDSIEEIKAKITGVGQQAAAFRQKLLGVDTPEGKRREQILRDAGMATVESASATGDATGIIGMGTTSEMLSNIGGTLPGKPGNFVEMRSGNVSLGGLSEGRKQEIQAKTQEANLIDAFSKEASQSGKTVGDVLGEAFAKFTQNTIEQFQKAMSEERYTPSSKIPATPVTGASKRADAPPAGTKGFGY
jgi:hypothetical protein